MVRKFLPAGLVFLILLIAFLPVRASTARDIVAIKYEGIINPVAAEFMDKNIQRANKENDEALIIRLDTPGGLDTSMRAIIKSMLASDVPVVVYVSPSGARAASAGVFITMAAQVAAMAPETNIGAAHPVSMGQKMSRTMTEKVTNDAVAFIKSLAEKRGRNAEWAEAAVRNSVSITDTEALNLHVIDLIANNTGDLVKEMDGRKVETASGPRVLDTKGAKIVTREMGLRLKILSVISDPNVAYILMLLGFYGLFFEFVSPGAIFPGVIGAISLILAFYSFQTLPVNYAGLLLIILAIILFVLEIKITSHGVLTLGGIISMLIGSLMLFDMGGPFIRLSLSFVIPAVLITALFFAFTIRLALKAYRRKPLTGKEGLKGEEGTASSDIGPEGGMVLVHGEIWSAFSDEKIPKQEKIIVESMQGLKLKVRKFQQGGIK